MKEESISKNIQTLRKKAKWTLEQLAHKTGLTKSYLSKIERSKKAPPYSTISKIAAALGVDATFILSENLVNLEDTRLSFTRSNERKAIERLGSLSEDSLYRYTYEAIAFDKPGKNMEPFVLEPAFNQEIMFQHEGEEFIFILEGRHEFIYDGQKYIMEKGDSVYFDAAAPHSGRSLGKKKAKILLVMFNYKRL